MAWRLGLDLGTNSLGWAALSLDAAGAPDAILAAGSRIFGDGRDPQSGTSLAVDRRAARAARRRRDRFKQRQRALLKHLEADGLFPADPEVQQALAALDPYALRARALDEALSLHEIGRALFHLNQRRGFQSNRKADRGKDEDAGKIAIGVDRLKDAIAAAGARTFGEFLRQRRAGATGENQIPSVRTRLRAETGEGAKGSGYDFYPSRALLKDEFDAIWHAQAEHHPKVLTDEAYHRLHEIVFRQRPLRAPKVGACTLVPGEARLPKAHPLFQRRRLLEELNALMIVRAGAVAERLTPEQRDLLLLKLKDKGKVTFKSLREKVLKLDGDARFNKESEHRTELKGDEVAAEMGGKTRFGSLWPHLSTEQQWTVIERQQALESDADEAAFRTWLVETHKLTAEQARAVAGARLPAGHGRFGLTATAALLAALRDGRTPEGRGPNAPATEAGRVVVYSEAAAIAGYHHSDHRSGEVFTDAKGRPALPYYGVPLDRHIVPGTADPDEPDEAARIGRLTNPTVHIALNQLRRVVNRLIRVYGPPAEVALELARELKLSEDEKKERNRENSRNRLDAEKRSSKLAELGQRDNGGNRALLKLWEELNPENILDRRCIYSGRQISIGMIFSGAAEVDHILPFDATLDDSNANKILCLREANRDKRKRSPFEAWGGTPQWEEIAERASRLPRNKRWRFEPDAMERFAEEGGFLARHLVDTQYLGRIAHDYLRCLYPDKGDGSSHVWVSPGRLTEMVRRKLGLNGLLGDHNLGAEQPKNRKDHRHHAIDAVVTAILDRSMLQRIQRASGEGASDAELLRIIVPEPWTGFRDDLQRAVDRIVVAHRADHGTVAKAATRGRDQTAARLHNDTAYGFTGEADAKGTPIVVHRAPLGALKKPEHIDQVRDPLLRAALHDFTAGLSGKPFEDRIAAFPRLGPLDYRGIRRVRVVEPLQVIPIRDAAGRAYKGYKGDSNYRYDVWELPDGKWEQRVLQMYYAHQSGEPPRPHPAARKVLSLHRDDVLAIERGEGGRELVRVVKFSTNEFTLAPLNEGGALKSRHADKGDPFRYLYPSPSTLKAWRAREVRVDELGRVLDPGFPARKRRRVTRPGRADAD
ncbi:type II CRISPR RNA-guided endonuclease Cas9 [Sphingomonas sanxanigenens]|nr:type II CRISPR RNA-guided endonuclease Cas9 [Sphingomonas sanxanigenens]